MGLFGKNPKIYASYGRSYSSCNYLEVGQRPGTDPYRIYSALLKWDPVHIKFVNMQQKQRILIKVEFIHKREGIGLQ